jgi:hypothetical protein
MRWLVYACATTRRRSTAGASLSHSIRRHEPIFDMMEDDPQGPVNTRAASILARLHMLSVLQGSGVKLVEFCRWGHRLECDPATLAV